MVGHRRDGCSNTPYSETFNVAKENRFDLISAEGGYEDLAKSPRAECGPFAHHNLLGIEKAVSTEIINWILGKSFIAEVSG